MKIAILTPGSLPIPSILGGAIETLVTQLIDENELSVNPIEFIVFNQSYSIKNLNDKYKFSKFINIKVNSLIARMFDLVFNSRFKFIKRNRIWRSYYVYKCIKLINKMQIDIVLIEGNFTHILQLREYSISKIVLHLHTDILKKETILSERVTKECNQILVVSDFLRNRLTDINEENSGKTFVLKNIIDGEKFSEKANQEECFRLREKYEINHNELVFIYVGRISVEKGVKELILAFNMVSRENCILLIIGSTWFSGNKKDSYYMEIENLVLNSMNRIVLAGFVSQDKLINYYSIADLLICPSIGNEAAGLVILESLVTGTPVIASKVGGIPEYVIDNACVLVDYDDKYIESLSIEITKFIINKSKNKLKKSTMKNPLIEQNRSEYYYNFKKIIEKVG